MRAGDLDRRITIMAPSVVEDGEYGPQPGAPVVFAARVPAQVQDVLPSKSETQDGVLQLGEMPSRVRIRFMRGITTDMHILLHDEVDQTKSTKHEIAGGPAEIGRREWTEFMIREYTS